MNALEALRELVRLKRLRERIEDDIPDRYLGHSPGHWQRVQAYESAKGKAWDAAKAIVDAQPTGSEGNETI